MPPHFAGLDPEVLNRLSSLSLVARKVVEGTMAGIHRSPHRGSSVEFAQHRSYAPGDEVRRIDWKVFGRSERLVVKEYVEETSLACNLLLDASESMAFSSLAWTKFEYARWATAALAHLIIGARDTAGLVVFDDAHRSKVPPGNGAAQEVAILKTLDSCQPTGPTAIGPILQDLAPRLRQRGITMIFSDFFDDVDDILRGVRRLVHGGHEPILVQILDPLEASFELDTLVKMQGLEDSGDLKIDPKAIRDAYLREFQEHNATLARGARALSLDFISTTTDKPLDAVLSSYLNRRSARARGGGGR